MQRGFDGTDRVTPRIPGVGVAPERVLPRPTEVLRGARRCVQGLLVGLEGLIGDDSPEPTIG